MYTVGQLAELAGVSARTLRFYDERHLLPPDHIGSNGYRYYGEDSVYRLQQILIYREMGLELESIRRILDDPDFDPVTALRSQLTELQRRVIRYRDLIPTIEATIMRLTGAMDMSAEHLFDGLDEQTLARREREAVEAWGDLAQDSIRKWKSYSKERQAEIVREAQEIYEKIGDSMGSGPGSPEVRALLEMWHENLRNFYEPSIELLGGLGKTYSDHPEFRATFEKIHPDLPEFLTEAIGRYVDELETRWLERELGVLENES